MEETTEIASPEYVAAFNDGYLIATHLPDLSIELTKSLTNSDKSKGLSDGVRQHFNEKTKDLEPEWLKDDFNKSDNVTKDNDKTKGSIDLDKD